MSATVLVVEDEALQARSIKHSLERHGYEVLVAPSAEEGLVLVEQYHPDVLLLDLKLPGMDGLELLKTVRDLQEHMQVIVITAYGTVQTAVEAMRLGAYDYVTKPLDLDELQLLLDRVQAHVRQELELSYLRAQSRRTPQATLPLGRCPSMQEVNEQMRTFATLERRHGAGAPAVLLLGETGTGKGVIAGALHDLSPRRARPFIEVNCTALPDALLEAELFGYENGAFPASRSAKRGLCEAADGGTIFLDEIARASLEAQAKLLDVTETHTFRRLGSLVVRRVDVRVLAATSVDLEAAVARGEFHAALYQRLKVLTLRLPALREWGEDIFLLADHFIRYHCQQYGLPRRRLSRRAQEIVALYHWPGNVRELANEIEHALLLENGDALELSHLPWRSVGYTETSFFTSESGAMVIDLPAEGIPFETIERQVLRHALQLCQGNIAKTARFLRLSRDTLRYRIERLGLPPAKSITAGGERTGCKF